MGPNFHSTSTHINLWVDKIIQERKVSDVLLNLFTDLVVHMKEDLCNMTNCDIYPIILDSLNSSLLQYNHFLIYVNCKLEALLLKEVENWNKMIGGAINVRHFHMDHNLKNVLKSVSFNTVYFKSNHKNEQMPQQIEKNPQVKNQQINENQVQQSLVDKNKQQNKSQQKNKNQVQQSLVDKNKQQNKSQQKNKNQVQQSLVDKNKQQNKSQQKNENQVKQSLVDKNKQQNKSQQKNENQVKQSLLDKNKQQNKSRQKNENQVKQHLLDKNKQQNKSQHKNENQVKQSLLDNNKQQNKKQQKNKNQVKQHLLDKNKQQNKSQQKNEKQIQQSLLDNNKQQNKKQQKNKNQIQESLLDNNKQQNKKQQKNKNQIQESSVGKNKQQNKKQQKNKNQIQESSVGKNKQQNKISLEDKKQQKNVNKIQQSSLKKNKQQNKNEIEKCSHENDKVTCKNDVSATVKSWPVQNSCDNVTDNKSSPNKSYPKSDIGDPGKMSPVKKIDNIAVINPLIGKEFSGSVIHILSPLEIYIYFAINNTFQLEIFEELEKIRKSNCLSASKPKGKSVAIRKGKIMEKLGSYALFLSESGSELHRVKIIDWKLSSNLNLVTVKLIDFGTTLDVTVYRLLPFPEKFAKYPPLATRCHLAGFPEEERENQTAIDFVRQAITQKIINIVVVNEENSTNPESLPVLITDKAEEKCLNKLVLEKIGRTAEAVDNWDPMAEAYESSMNRYEIDVDDPAASIYGYVGKDYVRVCKHYGNTGTCFKTSCRKEHTLLDPNGFTTDKEEVYVRALDRLVLPKQTRLKIRVTHFASPTTFYCVSESVSDNDETLASLERYINENVSNLRKLSIAPGVGQLVITKYNDSWHRARVVSVLPETDECSLFHVDHGVTTNVQLSQVRDIEPRYLHLPFQAIFCEISGIGALEETFAPAMKYLSDILTEISTIEIISNFPSEQPRLLVKLYTTIGDDVAEMLIKRNLVSYKESIQLDEKMSYLPG